MQQAITLGRATSEPDAVAAPLEFLWLEITGKCQLGCEHCYAESGPTGGHGAMTTEDWFRVIDEAAALGVAMVQFIGGEPTLHPHFPEFVDHAVGRGLRVEVYSNLLHVSGKVWEVLSRPGVQLATSYYSDVASEHAAITRGSQRALGRTEANIAEAGRRGIDLRVGLIDVREGQRVPQARARLLELGVHPERIGSDLLREVGRGIRQQGSGVEQLCGRCSGGVAAVSPAGEIWPCVFSRWLSTGNVRHQSLREIVTGSLTATRAELQAAFDERSGELSSRQPACQPDQQECVPRCTPLVHCVPVCSPRP